VLLFWLISAGIFGAAGAFLLDAADRGGEGFMWGFLLGPIGLVIAWVRRDDALREREEKARRHKTDATPNRVGIKPEPATPTKPQQLSPIEELERLAALKERGHLTDEEFARRKAQLLGTDPPPQPQVQRRRFK
jgi:hypothetical protein